MVTAKTGSRWTYLRNVLARMVRETSHIAWTGLKFIVAIVAMAWLVGLPGNWLIARLNIRAEPFELRVQRITWNPLKGIIAHRVDILEQTPARAKLFTADDVIIQPDYHRLWQGTFVSRRLDIRKGHITVAMTSADAGEPAGLDVRDIDAAIVVDESSTTLGGFLTAGSGIIMQWQSRIAHVPGDLSARSPTESFAQIVEQIHAAPAWLREIIRQLHQIENPAASIARLNIDIQPEHPELTTATFAWQPRDLRYRGYAVNAGLIELNYSNRVVSIGRLQLATEDRTLLAEGTYQVTNDIIQARIYGEVIPDLMAAGLPPAIRKPVEELGLKWEGTMHAEGWIGPCPLADIAHHWSAWVTIEQGQLNELPVDRFFASIKKTQDGLKVEEGLLEGGTGPGRGTVRFDIAHDQASGMLDGNLALGIEMRQLDAILPPGLRNVASMFEIIEQPVVFNGTFSLPVSKPDDVVVRGAITGSNFFFRTTAVSGAEIQLLYTNNIVMLDPFVAMTATGGVRGSLVLDFNDDIYDIALDVDANPHRVSPMAGESFARHFDPYVFSDDLLIRVQGRVDVRHDAATDLMINASGRRIGYGGLMADHILMQAHRTPGLLQITNIVATIAGGTATGTLEIAHRPDTDYYSLDMCASNIPMDDLIGMLNPATTNRYEGTIGGCVELNGPFPDTPDFKNLRGQGYAIVDQGRLLLIPIFGGLSTLLGKIYPGLGFSEQTHAEADLVFRDGKIIMDNVAISGNLLSLSAKGNYRWNDELDYDVLVQPLRDGVIASAVRVVTLPISKLLEFNVTGSVTNPLWNAVNLPLL